GHRNGGVRIGVYEDVTMIERGDQPGLVRKQHDVAKNIARHVADTDDGEGDRLDVAVHLAEVSLDRLPCALGRYAHALVVVTRRPSRSEGIIEPEIVLLAYGVGGVGESGCPLVRRDDEIWIVLVQPHDIFRR